jgi:hypothetical protein
MNPVLNTTTIIGKDGSNWGIVTGEEKKVFRLENGRIAKKKTHGINWIFDFETPPAEWGWGEELLANDTTNDNAEDEAQIDHEEIKGLEILGFRTEQNLNICSFGERNMPTHIFLFRKDDNFYKCIITVNWDDCMSGWCSSTWCNVSPIEPIDRLEFGPIHYVPSNITIGNLVMDDYFFKFETDDQTCVFEGEFIGGDEYYPTGYCSINLELFNHPGGGIPNLDHGSNERQTLINLMNNHPPEKLMGELAIARSTQVSRSSVRIIYIFSGPSDLGKSSLAIHTDLMSYDTDQCENIPWDIYKYDIIVIGNRFPGHKEKVQAILEKKLQKEEHLFRVSHVAFS